MKTITLSLSSLIILACSSNIEQQSKTIKQPPASGTLLSIDSDDDSISCQTFSKDDTETPNSQDLGQLEQGLGTLGGSIPHPGLMGAWDNGARDPIPSSSDYMSYSWDSNFNSEDEDYVAFALADIDNQTRDFRIPYNDVYGGGQFHVDYVNTTPPARCLSPMGAGSCFLAEVQCSTWGQDAGASYRVCDLMRLRVYVDNLNAYITSRGHQKEFVWHQTLMHELGHVLGLPHSNGVMSPSLNNAGIAYTTPWPKFTACQLATLRDFEIFEAPLQGAWTYISIPAECL